MSKQFGQAGAGSGMDIDPTKMGSPDGSSGILASLGHEAPSGDAGDHASPPIDASGDGATPPIIGDHQTDPTAKRKKIDWKGIIQNSLAGADDQGDEDPLSILQMHQSNQNSYMNPRTY